MENSRPVEGSGTVTSETSKLSIPKARVEVSAGPTTLTDAGCQRVVDLMKEGVPLIHCAPLMHQSMGTVAGGGTVRFSIGHFNDAEQITSAIEAVSEITSTSVRA